MSQNDSIFTTGLEVMEATEQSLIEIGTELRGSSLNTPAAPPPTSSPETEEQLDRRLAEEDKAAQGELATRYGKSPANEREAGHELSDEYEPER